MSSSIKKADICPCCGTDNVRVYDCGLPSEPCWTVECLGLGCGLSISGFSDEAGAIAAWNRRAYTHEKKIKRWEVLYTTPSSPVALIYIAEADNMASASFAARNYAESIGQQWNIKAIAPVGGRKITAEERSILFECAKAQRQGNEHDPHCPRCGKRIYAQTAKSRAFDISICLPCVGDEALRAYTGEELPVRKWAAVRRKTEPAPLKTPRNGKNGC